MAKLTLDDVDSLTNETTAVATINDNSALIEAAIENTLSRNGTSPNTMGANLDMNSYKIVNLAAPVNPNDAARFQDIADIGELTGYVDDAEAAAVAAAASQAAAAASASAASTSATNAATSATAAAGSLTAITTAVTNATPQQFNFNGNGATTTFSLGITPAETNTHVFIDGVYQSQLTWSISGTDIVFTTAPPSGTNNIEVMVGPFQAITTTTIGGVTGLQAALDLKAPLASPTFTGTLTVPTIAVTNDITITDDLVVGDDLTVTDNVVVGGTIALPSGTVGAPSYTFTGDTDLGIYRTAANTMAFAANGEIQMRIKENEVGIYADSGSASIVKGYSAAIGAPIRIEGGTTTISQLYLSNTYASLALDSGFFGIYLGTDITNFVGIGDWFTQASGETLGVLGTAIISGDQANPTTSGNSTNLEGIRLDAGGFITAANYSGAVLQLNRMGTDGEIVGLYAQGSKEGSISVSGATVAYGTFTGVHWSQLDHDSKPDIPRGTVIETIDKMAEWDEGSVNSTLAKCKINDTLESKAVYGVFFAWDEDMDPMIASLGTFVIRVRKGEVLEKGDLLDADGHGCAKKQSDDIVRSRTIAKVTAAVVVEEYADGSYLVPCTLMCG